MALQVNGTEITKVVFNGQEVNALRFNDGGYYGKRFALTKLISTGVVFTLQRLNSPNQNAVNGVISQFDGIYYGDVINISVVAETGYINPKLYVDIGDGNGAILRSESFDFTVVGNVSFYATSTVQGNTESVLWSGEKAFTSSGSFFVSGISTTDKIKISGHARFASLFYDPTTNSWEMEGTPNEQTFINKMLPLTLSSGNAFVCITVENNALKVDFNVYEEEYKGFIYGEYPLDVVITEIRREI